MYFLFSFVNSLNLQVKINGQNVEMLRAAAEQFGDKSEDEIAFGNAFLFLWTTLKRILKGMTYIDDVASINNILVVVQQTPPLAQRRFF